MLTDSIEIEIISRARQRNVRDHKRSREHFTRIFNDYLDAVEFSGAKLLDFGPGQYDFGVLADGRGSEIWAVDNDPAVIELGRHKGFNVVEGSLKAIASLNLPQDFDGLFCKFSLNMFWFCDDLHELRRHLETIDALRGPHGWAWLAFWNGVPKNAEVGEADVARVLDVGWQTLRKLGYQRHELSLHEARYYGVHGATADRVVYTCNIGGRSDSSGEFRSLIAQYLPRRLWRRLLRK